MSFLYERITKGQPTMTGTLDEPEGAPEPRFALQGTVHWMHALSVLVQSSTTPYDKNGIQPFYAGVQRSTALSDRAINTVFEQLLMSLHHVSALRTMRGQELNLARAAIMTWYYGIYCAASAMIAAKDGTQQQDHAGTANVWDRQIVANGHAAEPFSYRLTTLENPAAEREIATLRGSNSFNTSSRPSNPTEAFGACISYLSGTREYRVWQVCEDLRQRELPKLGLTDFRKAAARQLRDARLRGKSLGFLHQAFRYRGKANYRDALFLTYGSSVGGTLTDFIKDLEIVLTGFIIMAGAFCARRIGPTPWQAYIADLSTQLQLAVMPQDVWL
jgi:hypothetical protein